MNNVDVHMDVSALRLIVLGLSTGGVVVLVVCVCVFLWKPVCVCSTHLSKLSKGQVL